MRLILYLGKGGVGKTTTAAATAVRAAELGKRTLVVSTDVAHSLADALNMPLGAQPTPVAPNLWGQEINVLEEVRRYWERMQKYVQKVMQGRGAGEVMAEELAVIPGMEEVVSLLQIRREAREGNFDVVIVDAAPTGETVRLLTMPETFKLYAERLVNSTSMKLMRPFIRTFSPSTDVMDGLDKLTREVEELRTTLTDPDISSYRVVLTPERMVLKEAQRAATYLALYGYPVDGVVLNRVLPDEVAGDSFMGQLAAVQRGYREEAYNTFKPLPIWEAPYEPRDLAGLEDLSRLGLALFGDDDPTRVFYRGATQQLEKDGDGYILTLPLPHVELDKVQMRKRGDQLFVEIGNFRRELILPLMLSNREATGAVFRRDGTLEIKFGPAPVPVIQPAAAT